MLTYTVNRIMVMIPTLLIISFVIFAIIQLPPGDYLETYMAELAAQGEDVAAEKIEFLREAYGLDKPRFVQYAQWLFGATPSNTSGRCPRWWATASG